MALGETLVTKQGTAWWFHKVKCVFQDTRYMSEYRVILLSIQMSYWNLRLGLYEPRGGVVTSQLFLLFLAVELGRSEYFFYSEKCSLSIITFSRSPLPRSDLIRLFFPVGPEGVVERSNKSATKKKQINIVGGIKVSLKAKGLPQRALQSDLGVGKRRVESSKGSSVFHFRPPATDTNLNNVCPDQRGKFKSNQSLLY